MVYGVRFKGTGNHFVETTHSLKNFTTGNLSVAINYYLVYNESYVMETGLNYQERTTKIADRNIGYRIAEQFIDQCEKRSHWEEPRTSEELGALKHVKKYLNKR